MLREKERLLLQDKENQINIFEEYRKELREQNLGLACVGKYYIISEFFEKFP